MDQEIRTVNCEVLQELEDSEVLERAMQLVAMLDRIQEMHRELAQLNARTNQRIDEMHKQTKHVQDIIRTREERRTVECYERRDFAKKIVEIIYQGEVIETRKMVESEMQLGLKSLYGVKP